MKPLPLHSLKPSSRLPLRWPVASLRTYLLMIIVVATVPLGALTSWLMAQEILAARRQLSQGLTQTAGSLALMVEREQVSSVDALTILSHTTSLKEGVQLAQDALHTGLAWEKLDELVSFTAVFRVENEG